MERKREGAEESLCQRLQYVKQPDTISTYDDAGRRKPLFNLRCKMFYPHNVTESRARRSQRDEEAAKRFPRGSREFFAEMQLLHLMHIADHGLPDCYKKFNDFLYDFYPNFSWKLSNMKRECEIVMGDHRFPVIVSKIKQLFDFNLEEELKLAIRDANGSPQ